SASLTSASADSGSGSASAADDAASASASVADTPSSTMSDDDDDDKVAARSFDVGLIPDAGVDACACKGGKMGGLDFSYIWIANTAQGTLTKLGKETLSEH